MAAELLLDAVTAIAPDGTRTAIPLLRDGKGVFPNGTAWTNCAPEYRDASQLYYGDGIWVGAAGQSYDGLRWSTDGVTWTPSNVAHTSVRSVNRYRGLWTAAGSGVYNNDPGILWSEDGKTWTAAQVPMDLPSMEPPHVTELCGGNGIWMAGTFDGVLRSEDGKVWKNSGLQGAEIYRMCFGGGVFVALVQKGGTTLHWSTDGRTWTQAETGGLRLGNLRWVNQLWLVFAYDESTKAKCILRSTDGRTWTRAENWVYTDVAWGGGLYLAVNYDGTVHRSTDGLTWTTHTVPGIHFDLIRYGQGIWLAADEEQGTLHYSTDGLTWTECPETRKYGRFWRDIQQADGVWLASNIYLAGAKGSGIWRSVTWAPS